MSDPKTELARTWLRKARNDLITAVQTLQLPDGPTDTVCFHAQQAIEKALKAALTYEDVAFPRIHNLVKLLDLAGAFMPELDAHRGVFAELSAYAVEMRYPGEGIDPTREEATRALAVAERVVDHVESQLSTERQE